MHNSRDYLAFHRRMPLSAAYADAHGWVFGSGKKHKFLRKGSFKYSMSGSPSDCHADKNILRDLMRFDRTGAVNGNPEKSSA